MVKKQRYLHISRFVGITNTILYDIVDGKAEEKMGREHQGLDRLYLRNLAKTNERHLLHKKQCRTLLAAVH